MLVHMFPYCCIPEFYFSYQLSEIVSSVTSTTTQLTSRKLLTTMT